VEITNHQFDEFLSAADPPEVTFAADRARFREPLISRRSLILLVF
jgi:hypothetical protein